MQICKSPAADSWLCNESLTYVAECLELCEDSAMVQDLRGIFPRESLLAATKRVSPAQRKRLRQWVILLNQRQNPPRQR
jgi:hypothetical protein